MCPLEWAYHLIDSLMLTPSSHPICYSYVEEDGLVAPDAERIPPGISVAQGRSSVIPTPPSSSTGACNDPNSFKVAIIDSGLDASHPDIPCRDINAVDTNCKGTSIGINGQAWYEPSSRAWHGTHVFGTIGAIGGNNQGVTSMLPTSNGICYLIARVFDDDNNGQFASVIFEGIDWAISEGANVINMSLSGPTTYTTGQRTFDAAYAKGALAVAAAGNGDSTAFRYPASYDKVLAVAAVDSNG
jgi:serine protease